MSVPTVFLSAATVDLEDWRNLLHEAFMEGGFRVLTQGKSLGMPPRDVRHMLVTRIDESDCVIHLAGLGYGAEAADPFPANPEFRCSWTQFEYYYAHQRDMPVIAFVCAPELSRAGFQEQGDAAESARKTRLQEAHRQRVASGKFNDTPLASATRRTLNRRVDSVNELIKAVAGSVREVHGLGQAGAALVEQLQMRSGLHRLPPRPEGFVGREVDLQKLRALDPAAGAVLTGLRGMGGIGKTALALVLAHEWAVRFPDAQLFLDARGTQANSPSAGDLLAQVIQTFRPTAKLPDDEAALKSIYHDLLHGKKALLLLDNARGAAQAAPLIPPAGCALIVTSRQSFMLGTTAPHDVGRLPEDDAIALLCRYYPPLRDAAFQAESGAAFQAACPSGILPEEGGRAGSPPNAQAGTPASQQSQASQIARLCGYLPLALRLAGCHLALDASERGGQADVAGYLAALRGGRLASLDADAPDAGEISLSETLRLSETLLPEAELAAWRALGVFTGSFEARAAEAVAGASETMLAGLVRRSMLERAEGDRYVLHDLVADYARAALGEAALADLLLAHARHYAAVGEEADQLYLAGQPVEGLALFDRERGQIEAAFEWLQSRASFPLASGNAQQCGASFQLASGSASPADHASADGSAPIDQARSLAHIADQIMVHLVAGVAYTGELRFHPRQRIAWLEAQLTAARLTGNRQHEGAALGNLGLAHAALGDARRAIEFYGQRLVIAREIGDRRGEGNALGNLGLAHADLGDARRAIEFHEQALIVSREIGDQRGEGNALGNLGLAHEALGDARRAMESYEQQLAIVREIGDRRGEGNALGSLGLAHSALGDARRAIEFHQQNHAISREIGDRRGESYALGNLGLAHSVLGDARRAIELHEQQLAILREIGDRRGEGHSLGSLGLAHSALGDARRAIEFSEQYLSISREIGDRRGESYALCNLGVAHSALGDAHLALEVFKQQLVIVREIGDRRGEGIAFFNSAEALDLLGNRAEAIARAEAALRIFEAIEDPNAEMVRAKLAEWRA